MVLWFQMHYKEVSPQRKIYKSAYNPRKKKKAKNKKISPPSGLPSETDDMEN